MKNRYDGDNEYADYQHRMLVRETEGQVKEFFLPNFCWMGDNDDTSVRIIQSHDKNLAVAFLLTVAKSMFAYGYGVVIASNDDNSKDIIDYISSSPFSELEDHRGTNVFVRTGFNGIHDLASSLNRNSNDSHGVVTLMLIDDNDEYQHEMKIAERNSSSARLPVVVFRVIDGSNPLTSDTDEVINLDINEETGVSLTTGTGTNVLGKNFMPVSIVESGSSSEDKYKQVLVNKWNVENGAHTVFTEYRYVYAMSVNIATGEWTCVNKSTGEVKQGRTKHAVRTS